MNNKQGKKFIRITIPNNCEFLLTIWLFLPIISMTFINTIRYFIPNTYKLDTLLLYALLAGVAVRSIGKIIKRIDARQLLLCMVVITTLLFAMIFSENMSVNLAVIKDVCISCIPALLLAGTVRDFKLLKRYLSNGALIASYCLLFVVHVLHVNVMKDGAEYSQSMSFLTLLYAIILLGDLTDHFCMKYLIPFGINIFMMLSLGARAPLLIMVLYAFIKFLFYLNTKKRKNRMIVIALVLMLVLAIGMILSNYLSEILSWLTNIMLKLGLSVRIMDSLMNQYFFTSKPRVKLYQLSLERIWENPIIGTGAVNDRIYLASAYGMPDGSLGSYPHNFFIEVFLQFGLIIGSILLLLFVYVICKCLSKNVVNEARNVVLTLLGFGFLPLLFSGSYINRSEFYILIGICGAVLNSYQVSRRTHVIGSA